MNGAPAQKNSEWRWNVLEKDVEGTHMVLLLEKLIDRSNDNLQTRPRSTDSRPDKSWRPTNPISRVTPNNHVNGLWVLNLTPPVTEHRRLPLRLWHPLDGEVTPRDFAVSPWLRSKRPKLGIHLKCPFD